MSSPFAETLKVDPAELRRFGSALGAGGEAISALTVAPTFEAAAGALPGAETATVLGRAPGLTETAFDAVSARLGGLSEVARHNADGYEQADDWDGDQGDGALGDGDLGERR